MTAEQNKQTRLAERFPNKQRLIGLLFSTIHHKPIFAESHAQKRLRKLSRLSTIFKEKAENFITPST